MTSRLNFTPAQMRAAAKVAKEFGVSVRLEADGAIVVSPSAPPVRHDKQKGLTIQQVRERMDGIKPKRSDDQTRSALTIEEFIAKADPNSRKVVADGRLWEWDDFKAHLMSGKPLNKREIAALEALSSFGVGVLVGASEVSIGPTTENRLEARGYIEVRSHERFPDRIGHYVLTESGLRTWEAIAT